MSQDYAEGNLYENLTKEIFKTLGIEIQIFDYAKHPDKQNEGIDAEITYPLNLKGVSLQIKMFRNTEKYGTFPWEVSRYLKEMKDFVEEPHNADFHIVIDPIEISISELKLIFWIIKTGNLPGYYRDIWKDAIKEFGIPSNDNSNWEKKQGNKELYFRLHHKNEDLYQLIYKHTAYQRNVRCYLDKLTGSFKFQLIIPSKMINGIHNNSYNVSEYLKYFTSLSISDIEMKLINHFKIKN